MMHFVNVVMGKLTATALETAYKLKHSFRAVRGEARHGSGVKQQGSLIAQSQRCVSTRKRSLQTRRMAELLLVSRWSHTLVVKIHLCIKGNLLSDYYLRASRTNMPWLMPIQLFVQSVPSLGLLF